MLCCTNAISVGTQHHCQTKVSKSSVAVHCSFALVSMCYWSKYSVARWFRLWLYCTVRTHWSACSLAWTEIHFLFIIVVLHLNALLILYQRMDANEGVSTKIHQHFIFYRPVTGIIYWIIVHRQEHIVNISRLCCHMLRSQFRKHKSLIIGVDNEKWNSSGAPNCQRASLQTVRVLFRIIHINCLRLHCFRENKR